MKKFVSIVFVFVILVTALCSCSNNNVQPKVDDESTNPTSSTVFQPDEEEKIDFSIFPEVNSSYEETLRVYREEVSKRFASGDAQSFISDKEWEAISVAEWLPSGSKIKHDACFSIISESYEEVFKYYYPVVFRDGTMLILLYSNEYGRTLIDKMHGSGYLGGNYVGRIHNNEIDDEKVISSEINYTATYLEKTGEVKVWQFGKVIDRFSVPENSIYCGFSYFEGYIFRNGTDVYSLKAIDGHNTEGSVECIAHNVQYVIDADYNYASDPWCQPLFLMTDGSIKCYVGWEGNEDIPDDPSHLCDLQYEGSYDK